MPDPQYRQRLQELADFLVATLPASWHEASLRTTFTSDISTRLEVSFRDSADGPETWARIPAEMMRDFAAAARAVRTELVGAGNPKCKGFVFRLSKSGRSSLDAEY